MALLDMFKKNEPVQPQRRKQPPAPPVEFQHEYKKGDVIGNKYEVYGVLGKGGCGIVYLAFCEESGSVYALKSFLDKFNTDIAIRDRFKKEALVWVSLGRHPFIVNARFVDEISGRLFVATEFIAPGENGFNSLELYLEKQPPNLEQSLLWAIQFCHGMEYAYSKGIKAHRDIKPANILIDTDRNIKISDFGLAGVIDANTSTGLSDGYAADGIKTAFGTGMGTPTHMPPEQFINVAGCDQRSDIYSFGVVLFQLANGGRLPFYTDNRSQLWQIMQHLHRNTPAPQCNSPLSPIILKCLAKAPSSRYDTFYEIRNEIETIYRKLSNKIIPLPIIEEFNAADWNNKGVSLDKIGKPEQALECYEKALELFPNYCYAWGNKGIIHLKLNDFATAIDCFDKALEIPGNHEMTLNNKATALEYQGKLDEAIACYLQSIHLKPNYQGTWINLSACQFKAGKYREALTSADKALEISPDYASAWNNKGLILYNLDKDQEAFICFYKAIQIDPLMIAAYENLAMMSCDLGRHAIAIKFHNSILAINPNHITSWIKKAQSLVILEQLEEALWCYGEATKLNSNSLEAWMGSANIFWKKEDYKQAFDCCHNALLIDPSNIHAICRQGEIYLMEHRFEDALKRYDKATTIDDNYAEAWLGKSRALDSLNRLEESAEAYEQYCMCEHSDDDGSHEEILSEILKLSNTLNESKPPVSK